MLAAACRGRGCMMKYDQWRVRPTLNSYAVGKMEGQPYTLARHLHARRSQRNLIGELAKTGPLDREPLRMQSRMSEVWVANIQVILDRHHRLAGKVDRPLRPHSSSVVRK